MVPRCVSASLLLGAVLGCAGGYAPPRDAPMRRDSVSIQIDNMNYYQATIYTVRDGLRQRIGIVNGNSSKVFSFRWTLPDIRMLIDLLSVGCIVSDELPVVEGDELLLIIEAADHRRASRAACR